MKTLVLSQRVSFDSIEIEQAAQETGYKTIRITGDNQNQWSDEIDLVAYCEGFMAEYISQNSNLVLLRPLDEALPNAPLEITQRKIELLKASELDNITLPAFIKPSDQKFFKAGIYHNLADMARYISDYSDDAVLVSEIVSFVDEYRFFCLNGIIVASSAYMFNNKFVGNSVPPFEVPNDIMQFAQEILKICADDIPPACVVDVGKLDSGNLALVEFNPAWASGIYNSKSSEALKCIENSCVNRNLMPDELRKFETFDCSSDL